MAIVAWKGLTGDWTTASDWDANSVPQSGDDVFISIGGSYTVTISTDVTANSLTFSDGSATLIENSNASLTLAGALTLSGGTLQLDGSTSVGSFTQSGGTLTGGGLVTVIGSAAFSDGTYVETGTGTTDLQGDTTLSGNTTLIIDGAREFKNEGTFAWQGGRIILGFNNPVGTIIDNVAGATFDDQIDGSILHNGTTFINAGTFIKSAGAGTTNIDPIFNNTGTVEVDSGTLLLDGGGTSSGQFSVASGATLNFAAQTYVITSGNIDGFATLSGGALEIDGTTSVGSFTQSDGDLTGSGLFIVTGSTVLTGLNGDVREDGSGTTDLKGDTTLSSNTRLIIEGARVIKNEGTFTWQGGDIILGLNPATAVIDNGAGATFDDQVDSQIAANGTTFVNAGTFIKSAGAGTTNINPAFSNTGRVEVDSGTLVLDGGGTSTGTFSVVSGATLNFGGGTYSITSGTIDAPGTLQVSLGILSITPDIEVTGLVSLTGGTLEIDGSATLASFSQSEGVLTGSGLVTVTGPATFAGVGNDVQSGTGTTDLTDGATLSGNTRLIIEGARVIKNEGIFTWQGGDIILGLNPATAVIDNMAGATFDDQVDSQIAANGTTFVNAGTFIKSAGAGTTNINPAFSNTGTVEVDSGTLHFAGQLSGSGQLVINGANAVLELNTGGDVFNNQSNAITEGVTFGANLGTLRLDDPFHFHGVINGFADGDVIDIANQNVTSAFGSGGFLNVTLNTGATLQYAMPNADVLHFVLSSDGNGGTNIGFDHFGVTPRITIAGPLVAQEFSESANFFSGVTITDANADTDHETFTVKLSLNGLSFFSTEVSGTQDDLAAHTLLLTGTLAEVNAQLAALSVFPTTGFGSIGPGGGTPGDINAFLGGSVQINVSDGNDGVDFKNVSVAGNEPPDLAQTLALLDPSSLVPVEFVQEGTSYFVGRGVGGFPLGNWISDGDVAAGIAETFTVTISDITGFLAANTGAPGGGGTITGTGTNLLTIIGSLDEVNADLATVTYTGTSPGEDLVTIAADDGRGGSGALTPVATDLGGVIYKDLTHEFLSFSVEAVTNAPPVISSDPTTVAALGFATALKGFLPSEQGISISDADSAGETISVELKERDVVAVFSANAGVSGGGGTITGAGTNDLVISGSLDQVNADLSTVTILGSQSDHTDAIDIRATDGRGGTDASESGLVIDAPALATVPGNQVAQLGVTLSILPITVSDADANPTALYQFALQDSTGGSFSIAGGPQTAILQNEPGLFVFRAPLDELNADLATLQYGPGAVGDNTISVHPEDDFGLGFVQQFVVSVNAPLSISPRSDLPGTLTLPVFQVGVVTPIRGFVLAGFGHPISISDADGGNETIRVELKERDSAAVFSFDNDPNLSTITGAGTNDLVISGSLAFVNEALAGVTMLGSRGDSDVIDVQASDGRGSTDASELNAVLDAPAVTNVPGNEIAQQGATLSTPGISVSDPDADTLFFNNATSIYRVELKDTLGSLTVTGGPHTTILGNGTHDLIVSAPLGELNTDLESLGYLSSAFGSDTIKVQTQDGFGLGDAQQIAVNVNAPPQINAPANTTFAPGIATPIKGISIADDDSAGETLSVTLSVSVGALSAVTLGGAVNGSGTKQLEISGTQLQINDDLGTLKYLSNSPGTDGIDITASDGRGGEDELQIGLTGNAPPVISFLGSQTIQKDFTTQLGATVIESGGGAVSSSISGSDGIRISDVDATTAGETISVHLTDTLGVLSATTNAPGGGGTITDAPDGHTLTISGSLAQVNADLSTLNYLANTAGADTISVLADDGRGANDEFQLPLAINAPPTVKVAALSLLVTSGEASIAPVFQVSDADATGETITAILFDPNGALDATTAVAGGGDSISGSGTGGLEISGTLAQVNADLLTLNVNQAAGPAADDVISIFATDDRGGASLFTEEQLLINQPPVTTTPSSATVTENVRATISGISVADPDHELGAGQEENFTVTLKASNGGTLSAVTSAAGGGGFINGAGTSQLEISGTLAQVNADLTTLSYFNRVAGTDTIDVQTRDGRGGSDDHQVAVSIDLQFNINPPPKLIKGYISGATVFADDNGNGKLDPGEFSATTDSTGGFTLTGGTGPLIAFGGLDTSTSLPFQGQLTAPADSTVVTPLTTVLNLLEQQGVGDAEARELAALGLAPSLDLFTLDPIAAALAGNLVAGAAEAAAAKVYDTVSLIASTLSGIGSSFLTAVHDVFAAISNAIAGPGIDLTNNTALVALIDNVAQTEGVTVSSDLAADIAAILAASNSALDHAAQTDTTGANLLADAAGVERLIQGAASTAFAGANGDAAHVDSFAFQFTTADGVTFGALAGQHTFTTMAVTESVSGLTNQTSDVITVSASAPGSGVTSVEIFDTGHDLGASQLVGDVWIFTAKNLAEGSHAFTATATDNDGHTSQPVSAGVADLVDLTPPSITVTESVSGPTSHTSDLITISASDAGSGVKSVEVFDNGKDLGAAQLVGGVWTFTAQNLIEGSHAFTATATDNAGNTSQPSAAGTADLVDLTPPSVTVTESVSGLTNQTSDLITISASDTGSGVKSVEVFDNGNDIGAAQFLNGKWTFTATNLADGSHAFTATASDFAGNTSLPVSAGAADLVDTKAPIPVMIDVVKDSSDKLTTLSGTSTALSTVSVFDGRSLIGTAHADVTGKWSMQANVVGGVVHSFTETATDFAGSVGASLGVTLFSQSANTALKGGSGNDFLIGAPNDSLTGGAGSDTFVFNPSFGKNVVKDFDLNADVLAFSHSLGLSAQQILADTHDVSGNAVIAIDATDTVTLTGIKTSQLSLFDIHVF